jgi:hypothetical protein
MFQRSSNKLTSDTRRYRLYLVLPPIVVLVSGQRMVAPLLAQFISSSKLRLQASTLRARTRL